jgi:hypothetical protein
VSTTPENENHNTAQTEGVKHSLEFVRIVLPSQCAGFAAGEVFGDLAGFEVAVLVEGYDKTTLAVASLLVEGADHAALDAEGFALDVEVVGSPIGRHGEDDGVFAGAFEAVLGSGFDFVEEGRAAVLCSAGGDRFNGGQELLLDAR